MNGKKRIAALISTAALAVGGAFVVADSAKAVTCYGDYCSNKDPQATGCSARGWTQVAVDVYAKTDFGLPNYAGRLEMRASTTCGSTQWARFVPVYGGFTYKIRAEQPETGYATS